MGDGDDSSVLKSATILKKKKISYLAIISHYFSSFLCTVCHLSFGAMCSTSGVT